MKMSLDDPRLTAYALGELPAEEMPEVETFLQESEPARKVVAEIQETAGLLEAELVVEPGVELAAEQREAIEEQARVEGKVVPLPAAPWKRGLGYAVAACFLALLGAALLFPPLSESRYASKLDVVAIERAQGEAQEAARRADRFEPPAPVITAPSTHVPLGSASSVAKKESLDAGWVDSDAVAGPAFTTPLTVEPGVDHDVTVVRSAPLEVVNGTFTFSRSGGEVGRRLSDEYRADPVVDVPDTAAYSHFPRNQFQVVWEQPVTTFSIDVDTASYANVRRFLNQGQLPRRDAVRIEEMVNYFSYDYRSPEGEHPFAANIEVAGCPWNPGHRLVRLALKGKEMDREERPSSNLVFLIDVSGSMRPASRLPLIKQGLRMLVKNMNENDRVAIVVYSGQARVHLESTSCEMKERILAAIDRLQPGGSTNGGQGIQQAYAMASKNFIRDGVNRVLLCTDGDFNVGITDRNDLVRMAKTKASDGIFLTVLGVGTDNYKDALMQRLGDEADGNYHYLDSVEEAHKVLVQQMNANLVTIAKDVKVQIEFNPTQVGAYRLVGYEKRMLKNRDFADDTKDAGEIGAGHTVTAFYEIVPPTGEVVPVVNDALKYQRPVAPARELTDSEELLTLKLRYKEPDGDVSKLSQFSVVDKGRRYSEASKDFRFAAAVASFGMVLRGSEFKGSSSFEGILELAEEAKGEDVGGYRAEFLTLVKKAQGLARGR